MCIVAIKRDDLRSAAPAAVQWARSCDLIKPPPPVRCPRPGSSVRVMVAAAVTLSYCGGRWTAFDSFCLFEAPIVCQQDVLVLVDKTISLPQHQQCGTELKTLLLSPPQKLLEN